MCTTDYISTVRLSQAENCNLEKADILEMTVSQLRQMVASTEMQCVYGYRACVQEVNDFLLGTRYDDSTRRRIVQHLCRRRPSLVPADICHTEPTFTALRVPAEAESASGESAADYEHLRMFSYSSAADSTTDGAADPCEAGSATISTTNNNTDTGFKYEVEETNSSELTAACFDDRGADKILLRVESTDDVTAVIDVHRKDTDADDSGSHVHDDAVLSPMWRPW